MTAIVPVILAGGGGKRLWPLSTPLRPKQFQALTTERTLLQETVLRFAFLEWGAAAPVIVTGAAYSTEALRQLADIGVVPDLLLVEPFGRNTAPAIAVAAHYIAASQPDALMLVLPADHHVARPEAMSNAIDQGVDPAISGALVTFGVVPTHAETGYGYIERGEGSGPSYAATRFVEKPPSDVAETMVKDGRHYWNAGIFLFSPQNLLAAMEAHAPEVADAASEALAQGAIVGCELHLEPESFGRMPTISIDHAVMEKADNVAVVPMDAEWSDVGSFAALSDVTVKDADDNAKQGFVVTEDAEGCFLRADEGVIAAIGLRNLAVVRTGDAVLVAPLDRSQDVRVVYDRIATLPPLRPAGLAAPVEYSANAARLHDWLLSEAFPVWVTKGWDTERVGFFENLTLNGSPKFDDDQKRLRVQARQIFVYCTAHGLGLDGPYLDTAKRGFAFLQDNGWQESGGWPHLFTPQGAIKDPMRDAYDHAFILFAVAALFRATGDQAALDWAGRTIAYLDAVMADTELGGFFESAPRVLPRRANPHMHLLEAFLALFDATGDFSWLGRARKMVGLFSKFFFDTESRTLREYFGVDWQPEEGTLGRIRETGHHWEWAFLLHEYGRRSGEEFGTEIEELTRFALTHGHSPLTGLAYNEVFEDGTVHAPNYRLWPQTEALRGLEMLRQRGRKDLDGQIDRLAGAVYERFIATAPGKGVWVDRLTPGGAPLSGTVPASSLYHLVTGILALGHETA